MTHPVVRRGKVVHMRSIHDTLPLICPRIHAEGMMVSVIASGKCRGSSVAARNARGEEEDSFRTAGSVLKGGGRSRTVTRCCITSAADIIFDGVRG
jgi:hypothetical protein